LNPGTANLEAQQRICDDWRTEFNHVRGNRRAIVRAGGHP
jgi:hypothetical protein